MATQLRPDDLAPRAPRSRQSELGQFFTPAPIAKFMASMFSEPHGGVRLLDAGAGEGALSSAFVARWADGRHMEVDAFEKDEEVVGRLDATLKHLTKANVRTRLHFGDFLETASLMIRSSAARTYTHAIMNPPYRKIATTSEERRLASSAGLVTVNLYTAFVGLALDLLADGGEMVAIIPRSFCNGVYYKPFRDWLFKRAALRRIHLFHSRRDAFAEADVLQENVILHLVRGEPQGDVTVSASTGSAFDDLEQRDWPFDAIVRPDDATKVIHIPMDDHEEDEDGPFQHTLASLGLDVATGPVVAFRLWDHVHDEFGPGDVPLIYPQHLRASGIRWPIDKKPNAIALNDSTKKWMFPRGWYVVVKRFSSKEERRRVVASLYDPAALPGEAVGFENKVNVLHANRSSMDETVARGLTIFLNSSGLDKAFRLFSGHTQVNASDLRRMAYPSLEALRALGTICGEGWQQADQARIDGWVEEVSRRFGGK